MTEITVRFHTDQKQIDPAFFDQLNHLAGKYRIHMEKKNAPGVINDENHKRQLEEFIRKADALAEGMAPQTIDSADLIREDRERL